MIDYSTLPLGKQSAYCDHYAPALLVPVARKQTRDDFLANQPLPFHGADYWTAYEISWLNSKGKPHVACGIFSYNALSPNIVESKSLKLYLNSLNQTQFNSIPELQKTIERDLTQCVQHPVAIELLSVNDSRLQTQIWPDMCLDDLDVAITHYTPQANLLHTNSQQHKRESLVSHLLRSNCPVTGQPDWASVRIAYQGAAIQHESLLHYICSFRLHQGFHEQCIERMFCDISEHCKPATLTIEGRFTRRGGLDINPFRSSETNAPINSTRLARQ